MYRPEALKLRLLCRGIRLRGPDAAGANLLRRVERQGQGQDVTERVTNQEQALLLQYYAG